MTRERRNKRPHRNGWSFFYETIMQTAIKKRAPPVIPAIGATISF